MTHRNLVAAAHALAEAVPVRPDDEILSYLPPSHLPELVLSTAVAPLVGAVVSVGDGPTGVATDLRDVRPTVLLGVPSLWSRLAARIEDDRSRAGPLERRVLDAALRRGRRRLDVRRRGVRAASCAGPSRSRRARAGLGLDRVRACRSSALAPLPAATADALGALGIVLRQCYGTAESSGLLTVEPADAVQPGSVGRPVPGTDVRIGDGGELLARGPQIARDAVGPDEWLPTGDRASLDEDGLLHLSGRTEDVIVTAAGATVDAAAVASALERLPSVRRAVVTGDGRPSIGALLELEPVERSSWATRRSAPGPRVARRARPAGPAPRPRAGGRGGERHPSAGLPGAALSRAACTAPVGCGAHGHPAPPAHLAVRAHADLVDEMYRP